MQSNWLRAGSALVFALLAAAGSVRAAPYLRDQGWLPEPEERLYTIINLTEDPHAFAACPLNTDALRQEIEQQMTARFLRGVYSPIAEGPDVATHEVEARLVSGSSCEWQRRVRYRGDVRDITS